MTQVMKNLLITNSRQRNLLLPVIDRRITMKETTVPLAMTSALTRLLKKVFMLFMWNVTFLLALGIWGCWPWLCVSGFDIKEHMLCSLEANVAELHFSDILLSHCKTAMVSCLWNSLYYNVTCILYNVVWLPLPFCGRYCRDVRQLCVFK